MGVKQDFWEAAAHADVKRMGELLSEAGEAPEGLLLHLYNGQSPLQAARHNKAHLDKVDAASEQQIAAFQKCIDVLSEALRTVATSAVKDANKDELAKVFAAGGSLFDVNDKLTIFSLADTANVALIRMVRDHDAAGFSRASLTRHPSISAGPLPCIYASTNDAPDEAILCFVEPVFKELMHLVPTLLLSADEQANCINWLQQLVDLSQDDMAEVVSGLDSLYDAAVKARNIWFIRALLACGVNSDEQSLKTAIVQNASYKNLVEQFQRVMNAQVLMRMLFESPKPNWTAISGALQGSATSASKVVDVNNEVDCGQGRGRDTIFRQAIVHGAPLGIVKFLVENLKADFLVRPRKPFLQNDKVPTRPDAVFSPIELAIVYAGGSVEVLTYLLSLLALDVIADHSASFVKLARTRNLQKEEDAVKADLTKRLQATCEQGNADQLEELLQSGADVGKGRGAHLLRTLLNLDISQSQRLRMITVLLDHHASPSNAQDDLNITPAALAAQLGNLSIVQLLSSVGVDLDETPAGQQPPIYYAAVHGRVEIVRTLVAWGVRMPEQLSGTDPTSILNKLQTFARSAAATSSGNNADPRTVDNPASGTAKASKDFNEQVKEKVKEQQQQKQPQQQQIPSKSKSKDDVEASLLMIARMLASVNALQSDVPKYSLDVTNENVYAMHIPMAAVQKHELYDKEITTSKFPFNREQRRLGRDLLRHVERGDVQKVEECLAANAPIAFMNSHQLGAMDLVLKAAESALSLSGKNRTTKYRDYSIILKLIRASSDIQAREALKLATSKHQRTGIRGEHIAWLLQSLGKQQANLTQSTIKNPYGLLELAVKEGPDDPLVLHVLLSHRNVQGKHENRELLTKVFPNSLTLIDLAVSRRKQTIAIYLESSLSHSLNKLVKANSHLGAQQLLDAGASPEFDGASSMDIALRFPVINVTLISILAQNGANLNTKTVRQFVSDSQSGKVSFEKQRAALAIRRRLAGGVLIDAVKRGDIVGTKLDHKYGGDVNLLVPTRDNDTAKFESLVDVATSYSIKSSNPTNFAQVIKYLCACGADVLPVAKSGYFSPNAPFALETALQAQSSNASLNLAKVVETLRDEVESRLITAFRTRETDIVSFLLPFTEMTKMDDDDFSAVYYAIWHESLATVQQMYAYNPRIATMPACGEIGPIFLAAEKGDTALVRWLLTLPGVTANVTDSAGKKPIDYVNKEKFPYTARLLEEDYVTSLRKTVVLNDKQVDPEYSLSQLKRIIDRGNVQQLEHFISMEYARNEDKMKLVEEAIAYAMRFKHMDISARLESHLKDLQVKKTSKVVGNVVLDQQQQATLTTVLVTVETAIFYGQAFDESSNAPITEFFTNLKNKTEDEQINLQKYTTQDALSKASQDANKKMSEGVEALSGQVKTLMEEIKKVQEKLAQNSAKAAKLTQDIDQMSLDEATQKVQSQSQQIKLQQDLGELKDSLTLMNKIESDKNEQKDRMSSLRSSNNPSRWLFYQTVAIHIENLLFSVKAASGDQLVIGNSSTGNLASAAVNFLGNIVNISVPIVGQMISGIARTTSNFVSTVDRVYQTERVKRISSYFSASEIQRIADITAYRLTTWYMPQIDRLAIPKNANEPQFRKKKKQQQQQPQQVQENGETPEQDDEDASDELALYEHIAGPVKPEDRATWDKDMKDAKETPAQAAGLYVAELIMQEVSNGRITKHVAMEDQFVSMVVDKANHAGFTVSGLVGEIKHAIYNDHVSYVVPMWTDASRTALKSIDVHDLFHYVGIWCIDGAKYDVVDPKLPKFAWVGYCFGDAVSAKKRKMKEDIGAHQPRESPDKVKTRSDEDATISTVLQSSAYNSAISSIVVDQVQSLLVADDNVMLNNKIEAVVENKSAEISNSFDALKVSNNSFQAKQAALSKNVEDRMSLTEKKQDSLQTHVDESLRLQEQKTTQFQKTTVDAMQAHRNEVTTRLDQSLQAIEQTLRTGLTTIETKQTAWFQSTMTHLDTTVESKYNAHKSQLEFKAAQMEAEMNQSVDKMNQEFVTQMNQLKKEDAERHTKLLADVGVWKQEQEKQQKEALAAIQQASKQMRDQMEAQLKEMKDTLVQQTNHAINELQKIRDVAVVQGQELKNIAAASEKSAAKSAQAAIDSQTWVNSIQDMLKEYAKTAETVKAIQKQLATK